MNMNKISLLLLIVMLVVSLAGCGSEDQIIGDSEGVAGLTTAEDNESAQDTATSPDTTQAETEAQTTAQDTTDKTAFDTSHATNDFEKLIPKLPFEGWTVLSKTDTEYKLQKTGLNTGAATNPPNSTEPDGADKDRLLEYLSTLSTYGFTVTEKSAGYKWLATDKVGNKIEFMIGDGGCWVTINKKA